ncbi:MAG: omptin family outer membrane protease [Treponema sp.]|jgi:outer membrane protease|nr:omptin family outer membrane protease [Treponema sp.]
MKKSITFFSFFVCLAFRFSLPAEDLFPYTFSIAPQFGIFYGRGEEQVFKGEESNGLLSQLLWDLKPLYYGGVKTEFARKNPMGGFGFFGSLSLKFGFPAESGSMEDRDWQDAAGKLTNYSRHDAFTNGSVILDLAAGPSIPIGANFALRPSLGISYTRFSWVAQNGYIRYGEKENGDYQPLKDFDLPQPISGTVVSYSQDWTYMPIGLSLWIRPDRVFSGALWFYGGPVLKFVGRDDHHFLNNTNARGQYWDEIIGGYSLEPGGEFRFSPVERVSLRLTCSWLRIAANPRGKYFARYTGAGNKEWNLQGNFSGGGFQTLDLGMRFEIRL